MKSKKTATVILDLSKPEDAQRMAQFEVHDYNYEHRQTSTTQEFEQDLHFLLSAREDAPGNPPGPGARSKQAQNPRTETLSASPKMACSPQNILADSGDERELSAQFSALKVQSSDDSAPAKAAARPRASKAKETHRISRKEITHDLQGIEFLSDDESTDVPRKDSPSLPPETRPAADRFEDFEALEALVTAARRKKTKKSRKNAATAAKAGSVDSSDPAALRLPTPGGDGAAKPASKPLKNAPKARQAVESNKTPLPQIRGGGGAVNTERTRSREPVLASPENTGPGTGPAAPKTADSLPTHKETAAFARLSSAKATLVTQLPAVQPVSTIFGLSHEQIYKTRLSDVKVKTIVNVPMSKMCKNALTFVMAENEGLFVDAEKTGQFVDLCTKVALYEAPGFNEVTKRIPALLDWVPQYEPLTLQHTKTNVTVSNKQIHKNCLDYTVFSFFGHILLWANELQHTAKATTIVEKYHLDISRTQILNSLGGYHLWDRLRRDKTINTKRWKHIQKFRQLFAFEEHQFVLILRCMNLGVPAY